MDANGIDVQVLSYTNFTQFAPVDQAVEAAAEANNRLAQIVALHPDRFGGFATLPWQDSDAAVRELDRSVHDLGLTATMLSGHPADDALADHPRYDPLLARLAELKVPLYIHPGPPHSAVQQTYYAGLDDEVTSRFSLAGWGWHNEAGIQGRSPDPVRRIRPAPEPSGHQRPTGARWCPSTSSAWTTSCRPA